MPRTSVAKCQSDLNNMAVVFNFTDDENLKVSFDDLPEEIRKQAGLAGLAYVLRNSYSGEEVPAKAREKLNDRLKSLNEGKWASRTPGAAKVSAIAQDYAVLNGVKVDEAAAVVKDMSREAKAAFRRDAETAFALSRIKNYEPADAMTRLMSRTEEERIALHGHDSITAEIEAEKARRAAERAKAAKAAAKGVSLDDI